MVELPESREPADASHLAIVAALREEVLPLLRKLRTERRQRLGSAGFHRGFLWGRPVVVGWTGEGRQLAATGIEALLSASRISKLVILGMAGGLSPRLEVGALVAATAVEDAAGRAPEPAAEGLERWLSRRPDVHQGLLYTAERIQITAREKAELWRRLGEPATATVDLETVVYARAAEAHHIPYLAVRAISDPVEEDLPLDFNRFQDEQGRIHRLRVALHALRHPRIGWQLWGLERRMKLCAARLAEAVEDLLKAL